MSWQTLFANPTLSKKEQLASSVREVIADPKKRFPEAFAQAEPFQEVRSPQSFHWELLRAVPVKLFGPGSREDFEFEAEENGEEESLAKYEESLELTEQGLKPPPILVDRGGMVLDGYHRLAALSDHDENSVVDVLWARNKKRST